MTALRAQTREPQEAESHSFSATTGLDFHLDILSEVISEMKWYAWALFMEMDTKKILKQTDKYLFCKYHGRSAAAVFWWPCLSFGLSCLVCPEPSQTAEPAWSGPPHWAHPSPAPSAPEQHHTDDSSHRAGSICMRTNCIQSIHMHGTTRHEGGHYKTITKWTGLTYKNR